MNILLTNDDGIAAPGLNTLLMTLCAAGHNVAVAAPAFENSAISHAITVHDPIFVDEYEFDNQAILGWSISGHPADCVKLALEVLLTEKPDIVVSGINRGPNVGLDTIYSGTVSAALEASMHQVPAVAFSLDSKANKVDYTVAAEYAVKIIDQYKEFQLPAGTMLNVNIPAVAKSCIKGLRVVELGDVAYDNTFAPRKNLSGRTYYWLGGGLIRETGTDLNKDVSAVANNWITLTPLKYDLTDYQTLKKIQKMIL